VGQGEAGSQAKQAAVLLVRDLRRSGIGTLLPFGDRSLRSQLKAADRAGVRFVAILGEGELAGGFATVRDLATGTQQPVARADLALWLQQQLA
jgi:histidyl-tRNA synthetase